MVLPDRYYGMSDFLLPLREKVCVFILAQHTEFKGINLLNKKELGCFVSPSRRQLSRDAVCSATPVRESSADRQYTDEITSIFCARVCVFVLLIPL